MSHYMRYGDQHLANVWGCDVRHSEGYVHYLSFFFCWCMIEF